jgi:hypothetical protein
MVERKASDDTAKRWAEEDWAVRGAVVIAAAREAYIEAREKFYREIIDAKRDDSEIERSGDDRRRARCSRRVRASRH